MLAMHVLGYRQQERSPNFGFALVDHSLFAGELLTLLRRNRPAVVTVHLAVVT